MDASTTSSTQAAVYQHESKPAWGLAVIAWERDRKRGYLFENGELRVLKDGYFHLMQEVDVSVDRAAALHEGVLRLTAAGQATTPTSKRRHVSVDEQFDYFLAEFPGGFSGDKWQSEHRVAPGRALKRHRDAAIAAAADVLPAERLASGLAADPGATLTAVVKLLTGTDLVPTAKARKLAEVSAEDAAAIVSALHDALWVDEAEGPGSTPFDRWVTALTAATGEAPTWMLATAPLTLALPNDHVCVRGSAFSAQASSLAPRLSLKGTPDQRLYRRTLAMAVRVRERATERQLAPADLLDVHDFIRFSMSPAARTAVLARRG